MSVGAVVISNAGPLMVLAKMRRKLRQLGLDLPLSPDIADEPA
jgi:hypothetical protein